MNKLKPKKTRSSISSIADLVRGNNTSETAPEKNGVIEEQSNKVEKKEETHEEVTISCLENVDATKYNCKEIVYVDEQIKEVFSLLKSKGKIKTSLLCSVILENWLRDNKEEVQAIINKGNNRFL